MTQPKRKKVLKISPNDKNNDDLKSLRDEFEENETLKNEISENGISTGISDPISNPNTKMLSFEDDKDTESSNKPGVASSDQTINIVNDLEKSPLEKDNFADELAELRSMDSQGLDEQLLNKPSGSGNFNYEKEDSKFKQRKTNPRNTNLEKSKNLSGEGSLSNNKSIENPVYVKPPEIDDSFIDSTNEDFINKISASLEEDHNFFETDISEKKHIENISQEADGSTDYVADIENEIEHAGLAKNPFEPDLINKNENDFMTKLQELFPENYHPEGITKPLTDLEEISNSEYSLSQESWQDVIKATEDSVVPTPSSDLLLEKPQRNDFEIPANEIEWDTVTSDRYGPYSDENNFNEIRTDDNQNENNLTAISDLSDLDVDESSEKVESVDVLRRSFIEEFEQTPWQPEIEEAKIEDGWLKSKSKSFVNWISSLNTAEKILLVMSSIISLAVIIAIGLVLFNWQSSQSNASSPPEIIDSVKSDSIYPTGLQLPGGWFFYLQQGEIKNNKWTPQTAEWMPNSTIRRVVAIPWSRQAEAVVQTLNTGDEIRVFMNNNDILNYYVEKVMQVDRDNIEILTDTEPSLAVILFKTDNSDRWVVIAKP